METQIHPCSRHRSIVSADMSWERALQIADDCPNCRVEPERKPADPEPEDEEPAVDEAWQPSPLGTLIWELATSEMRMLTAIAGSDQEEKP